MIKMLKKIIPLKVCNGNNRDIIIIRNLIFIIKQFDLIIK